MTPELLDLKRATHETIKGVGGLEAAASFCRLGKSVLGDNQSVNKPESFMAIDVVADPRRSWLDDPFGLEEAVPR